MPKNIKDCERIRSPAAERRITEALRLLTWGYSDAQIKRALVRRFGICPRTAHSDLAVAGGRMAAHDAGTAERARAILTAGYTAILRDALGINDDDDPLLRPELDAADLDHAIEVAEKRTGRKLRARDRSAALTALRELGKLHGAYAPEKHEHEVTGGVLVAPARVSAAEWTERHVSGRESAAGALEAAEVVDAQFEELSPREAPSGALTGEDW